MVHNFSFESAHRIIEELQLMIQVSRHNMEHAAKFENGEALMRETQKGKAAIEQTDAAIKFVRQLMPMYLDQLNSGHIEEASRRLQYWVDDNEKKWSELNTRARALRDAIQTELREYLFYLYPKERTQTFLRWKADWGSVLVAFPDLEMEVFSATDCYALQHHTASVFHSMRIAEIGLRALAKERRLRLPKDKAVEWATWQEIIRALEAEIKIIAGKKAGKAKDAALAFYSSALADLNGFKDEYRNSVMHVRAHYDEFQALRALTLVRGFMQRIAAKLDRSHRRINWGRF